MVLVIMIQLLSTIAIFICMIYFIKETKIEKENLTQKLSIIEEVSKSLEQLFYKILKY